MNNNLIIFAFFLLSCSSLNNKISSDDLRKSNISNELLQKGLVKEFLVQGQKGDFIFYDMIKQSDNKIILKRFDKDFNIVREDFMEVNNDGWTLKEMSLYAGEISLVPVKIIEPKIISFNPDKRENKSIISYNPNENVVVTVTERVKTLGKEKAQYLDKEIECIKYSIEQKVEVNNKMSSSTSQAKFSNGYSLFGDGIGWFYMLNIEDGDTVEYKIKSIMTMTEFDNIKQ